ncbi:MAG: hypothetical protein PHE58_08180 [Candidatus Omnitrophica bacterium]|nr:hypothetical protein [Candidatus Omnitrophota bacterium]
MKAIALISGGLDSMLAAKIMQGQGIEVIGLHCSTPFDTCAKKMNGDTSQFMKFVGESLGIPVIVTHLGKEFLDIVKNPRHGYGSHVNPCIDCRIFMLGKAHELMLSHQANFIITGEVANQRDMSQHKPTLRMIEKRAGLLGLIVRPLSAKILPETIPEQKNWIQRDNLFNFNGRNRRPQIELANTLGIHNYSQPAGGCLLTDVNNARKIRDLIEHNLFNLEEVALMRTGRHFRLSPFARLIVGRDQRENKVLEDFVREGDYLFTSPDDTAGPCALGRGEFDGSIVEQACKITCYYCDKNDKMELVIKYKKVPEDCFKEVKVFSVLPEDLKKIRI